MTNSAVSIFLKISIVCIITLGIVIACKKLPKYSNTPSISYEGYTIFRDRFNPATNVTGDSVIFKIKFQDGDGDLGLSEEDKRNDTVPNFRMQCFLKSGNDFTPYTFSKGQFQRLTLSAKNVEGPIDGTLSYTEIFQQNNFPTNSTVKFDISILDRAKNVSNTVTTEEIILNKP